MKPHNKVSNERLTGVSSVTITFVWNFQANAHSGRTTLMLNEKNRNQSNKEATLGGQSTWISYENKLAREPWSWLGHSTNILTLRENIFCRKLEDITKYLTAKRRGENDWGIYIFLHIHSFILDWVKDGLDNDNMRTAKVTQNTPTTASRAVVWDESGHLKQALFSL